MALKEKCKLGQCDIIETIKECPNSPIYLALLIGFLFGVIIGFLMSPVRNGIAIASNNTLIGDDDDEDDND